MACVSSLIGISLNASLNQPMEDCWELCEVPALGIDGDSGSSHEDHNGDMPRPLANHRHTLCIVNVVIEITPTCAPYVRGVLELQWTADKAYET